MLRVMSFNANGLRSAARKGFLHWFAAQAVDVLCVQETKAQRATLDDPALVPAGYRCYSVDAVRKGYSGVAIYSREAPDAIVEGLDWPEFDAEGRYIEARFGTLRIGSLYLPSGSSGEERQRAKYRFIDGILPRLQAMVGAARAGRGEAILCGDWNIAHREIDVKNWRSNQKNSGFLPDERAWIDRLLNEVGWVDAFRHINTNADEFTWWSFRGQAWAKNVGWRIDYQLVTPGIASSIRDVWVHRADRFSDHAPLVVDYSLTWPP